MAQIVARGTSSFAISKVDFSIFPTGNVTQADSSTLAVSVGADTTIRISGEGLTYDAQNHLTGGIVRSYEETSATGQNFQFSGLNLNAAQLTQWAQAHDNATALSTIFAGNDQIQGSSADDVLVGYAGHDVIYGGNGLDAIDGREGNDHLYGQSPNGGDDAGDTILGGDGGDYLQGNAGADTLDGGGDADRIYGGKDDDLIIGGDGNDSANGNLGNDKIDGGIGDDYLRGGQGNDSILGGLGGDVLLGDLGDDTLKGGEGADALTGGDGADLFQFGGNDATFATTGGLAFWTDGILDYADGMDHFALGFDVGAVLAGAAGSKADAFVLAQQLLNAHAQNYAVASVQVGGDTFLFWDSAGGLQVNSAVDLVGVSAGAIGTSDFA